MPRGCQQSGSLVDGYTGQPRGRAAEGGGGFLGVHFGGGRAQGGEVALAWPLTRLSFCWRPISIAIETPTDGEGGVQQNGSTLVNGSRPALPALDVGHDLLKLPEVEAMRVLGGTHSEVIRAIGCEMGAHCTTIRGD